MRAQLTAAVLLTLSVNAFATSSPTDVEPPANLGWQTWTNSEGVRTDEVNRAMTEYKRVLLAKTATFLEENEGASLGSFDPVGVVETILGLENTTAVLLWQWDGRTVDSGTFAIFEKIPDILGEEHPGWVGHHLVQGSEQTDFLSMLAPLKKAGIDDLYFTLPKEGLKTPTSRIWNFLQSKGVGYERGFKKEYARGMPEQLATGIWIRKGDLNPEQPTEPGDQTDLAN